VPARPLHSKHSLQHTEHLQQRVIRQNTQALDQAISIDSPYLINNYMTTLRRQSGCLSFHREDRVERMLLPHPPSLLLDALRV
jgi:hypothetical protein